MPIIAIGRELRRLSLDNDNLKLYYIGPKDKAAIVSLSQENFKTYAIVSGKIRRYFSFDNILDMAVKIPFGFLQSFFLLLVIRPKVVFSKGGSGSAIVCFCAKLLGFPIFLHESDSVPGLSNRIAYKWAKKIFISFPKTEYFDLSKAILVGNPIKKELLDGDDTSAKELFQITSLKPVLLFLGGSQGAESINDFILVILNDLLKKYEIIYASGKKNYNKMKMESELILSDELEKYYHLYESLGEVELKQAYKIADLVISRAGAGSIFEIAAAGKASILVPLPSAASNHQSKNAYQYAQNGAALIMEQENLTPNFFIGKINYLLSQPAELKRMREAALQFSKPLAAKAIAREILEFLG